MALWELVPGDEFPHSVAALDHPMPWKDTWATVLRDDRLGIVILAHITISPNRAPGCRTSFVVQAGGREYRSVLRDSLRQTESAFGTTLLSLDVSDASWDSRKRLVLRGDEVQDPAGVRFALNIKGVNPAAELGTRCPGALPRSASNCLYHVEQWVTFEGWLELPGGVRHELVGEGFRDRSWGWRKSEVTFGRGWLAALGRTGDTSFGFLNWPHPDDPGSPVGAWVSSPAGLAVGVGGRYRRDSTGRPMSLKIDFTDGRQVDVAVTAHFENVLFPFHEVDDGDVVAIQAMECFAATQSVDGQTGLLIADSGTPILADAFHDAWFAHSAAK
jgi:hypothetical protein